tara:strand:+ start:2961 stop:7094 length:4134 start_codon:yes stop_codon:yes gene_type:complete
MGKTTIRNNTNNMILYEFDIHLSHDCVKKNNYRDKYGKKFFASNHIVINFTEKLEEIIYYVETRLSSENTTMVYLQNWSQWSKSGLDNWDDAMKEKHIDIALVSFLVPYKGLSWPKKELCSQAVASFPKPPTKENPEWNSHSTFINRLKKHNPELKVLISYGGAGLGCCPGSSEKDQTVNFLAEQIKWFINSKSPNLQVMYDVAKHGGESTEPVINTIVDFISNDIANFVKDPDSTNLVSKSTCKEELVYDIAHPYTDSSVKDDFYGGISARFTNSNLSESLLAATNSEESMEYDGVNFDYEIDASFTHMEFALMNTANATESHKTKIAENVSFISPRFAKDLSNIIIKVINKVDSILNPKSEDNPLMRPKVISTAPFIMHFAEPNLFNKGLNDISNSIDIVGIQAYNNGPYIFPSLGSSGICELSGREAFTEILRNINETIGLDKTILLLANKPEDVGITQNNAGGGKKACPKGIPGDWAPNIELEPIDKDLYLKREATCYLGETWNNMSTEPKNDRQKNRYETEHKIRHKPLIELDEIVQSFNSLAHKVRNPATYNFSVTPSNEEYYCGTDHKIACDEKIQRCNPNEGCGEELTCFKCPAPSPGPSPSPSPGPSPDPTTDKLQFRGMGYWSIAGDDGNIIDISERKLNHRNEIKFASDIKKTLIERNNYKTSAFVFDYCEDIVPTGIIGLDNSEDDSIKDLLKKKHGCPLIVNELTNIDDIKDARNNNNKIEWSRVMVNDYIEKYKNNDKIYAVILKESCNIDVGNDVNALVLPCPNNPKSIIQNNTSDNHCSYDESNIHLAGTNANGIVVLCEGDSPTNKCVAPTPAPTPCRGCCTFNNFNEAIKKSTQPSCINYTVKEKDNCSKISEQFPPGYVITNVSNNKLCEIDFNIRPGDVMQVCSPEVKSIEPNKRCEWIRETYCENKPCIIRQKPEYDAEKDPWMDNSPVCNIVCDNMNRTINDTGTIFINCNDDDDERKGCGEPKCQIDTIDKLLKDNKIKDEYIPTFTKSHGYKKLNKFFGAPEISTIRQFNWGGYFRCTTIGNTEYVDLNNLMHEVYYYDNKVKITQHPYTMIGCTFDEIANSTKLQTSGIGMTIIQACSKDFPTYTCLNDGEFLTSNEEIDKCKFIKYDEKGAPKTKHELDCGDWNGLHPASLDYKFASSMKGWGRECRRSCRNCAEPKFNPELCQDTPDCPSDWNLVSTQCDPRGRLETAKRMWKLCPRTCSQVTEYWAWVEKTYGRDGVGGKSSIGGITVGYEGICKDPTYNKLWATLKKGVGNNIRNDCNNHAANLNGVPEVVGGSNRSNIRDNIKLKTTCISAVNSWRKSNCKPSNANPMCGSSEIGGNYYDLGDRGFAGNYKYNTAIRVKNVDPPVKN